MRVTRPDHDGTFGKSLRSRRVAARLTQEELSELSHVSVRSLREMESGRVRFPRESTVRLIAEPLGLHGGELKRFHRAGYRHTLDRACAGN